MPDPVGQKLSKPETETETKGRPMGGLFLFARGGVDLDRTGPLQRALRPTLKAR